MSGLADCNLTKQECKDLGYCKGHELSSNSPLDTEKTIQKLLDGFAYELYILPHTKESDSEERRLKDIYEKEFKSLLLRAKKEELKKANKKYRGTTDFDYTAYMRDRISELNKLIERSEE